MCIPRTVVEKTVKLDVSCHVVTPAHFAHFTGHPQKKGFNLDLLLREIKHAKGVSGVNLYLSAPLVSSVANAVKECRGKVAKILAEVTGTGCKSKGVPLSPDHL